jgi:hypothetical protein
MGADARRTLASKQQEPLSSVLRSSEAVHLYLEVSELISFDVWKELCQAREQKIIRRADRQSELGGFP